MLIRGAHPLLETEFARKYIVPQAQTLARRNRAGPVVFTDLENIRESVPIRGKNNGAWSYTIHVREVVARNLEIERGIRDGDNDLILKLMRDCARDCTMELKWCGTETRAEVEWPWWMCEDLEHKLTDLSPQIFGFVAETLGVADTYRERHESNERAKRELAESRARVKKQDKENRVKRAPRAAPAVAPPPRARVEAPRAPPAVPEVDVVGEERR